MPTITLAIRIDPALIPDGDIAPLLEALADFAPVLEELGSVMADAERQNFADEGETFGRPWAPLSPRTVAEKRRAGFGARPLVREGHLEAGIGSTLVLGANDVTAGLDAAAVAYGATQNAGDPARRLPARVLVGISASEVDALEQALRDWLAARTGEAVSGITITSEETD